MNESTNQDRQVVAGSLALNLVTRNRSEGERVKSQLKRHFSVLSQQSTVGEVNEVLICLPFSVSLDEPRFAKVAKTQLDRLAGYLSERDTTGGQSEVDVACYVAKLCKRMGKYLLK